MLPEEYHHEPSVALAGGSDGLDIIRRIFKEAARHLTEDGLLIMEIGHNQAEVERAFPQLPCTWLETSSGDQFVLMVRRGDLPA
ncbi:MAG: 50S ribosomal protein L3 N(5)-glutamine methyltransferase, partial [Nitrosomonas sp. PRO5]|nr:50S ribosomal protein L3 N(5)-glutamine methyltransferase [Nitrosomonas sp. PRO5]